MLASATKTGRIRELNDNLRRTFAGGQVMLTAGVNALPDRTKAQVLVAVREFNAFDRDNDPHGEHDFGSIEIDDLQVFFKVDYYDEQMQFLSDDPSNPACTRRVMTVMLADEY